MNSNDGRTVPEGDANEWFGAGHNDVYHVYGKTILFIMDIMHLIKDDPNY